MSQMLKVGLGIAVCIGLFLISLPSLVHKAGLHPKYSGPIVDLPGKRALIITTSHRVLAPVGEAEGDPTGVAASEMTHPYYTFIDGGMDVDLASIKGGEIPIDPLTINRVVRSPEDERFLYDSIALSKAKHSIPVEDIDIADYDIVFISGGWGASYDLAQSTVLGEKVRDAYYGDKNAIIGGVCHGVLGLVNARAADGSLLVAGRRMTGVTDKQIKELGIEVTPKHPETELRKAGAIFESQSAFRDVFATYVAVDDERRFVTGQNQNSGLEVAHVMMQVFAERDD